MKDQYIVADYSSKTEGVCGNPCLTFEGNHIFLGIEKAQFVLDKYKSKNPDANIKILKIKPYEERERPFTVDDAIKEIWGKLPEGKSYEDVKREFDNSPFNPKNLNIL